MQLVARDEDPVAAAVLELEVVARHAAHGLGVEAGEAGDAVVLVHDGVARAQVRERGDHRRAGPRAGSTLGPPAAEEAVLGHDRDLHRRRQEPLAEAGRREGQPRLVRGGLAVEERGAHARQVVGGALGLAAPGPGNDGPVSRADQLLQLGLGLPKRARGGVGALRAELMRLVAGDARQAQRGALVELRPDTVGLHVEVVRVGVVEAGRDVLPQVGQRGLDLLVPRNSQQGVARHQREQLAKAVHGEQLGHVRTLRRALGRRDLGQFPVFGADLRGRRDLHVLRLLQGALGEGREEREALDLHVEELAAHRALLGGRVDVEDVAADRELTALLHLVDPLVAACHEPVGGLVEVDQLALLEGEAVWAERRVGDLLAQGGGGGHHHGGAHLAGRVEQRIERGDPEAHQVRRRRQVRLVLHPAGRVEAHEPRRQECLQVRREVAGGAVVARDHERGALGLGIKERSEQVGPHARRHERPLPCPGRDGASKRGDAGILVGIGEQGAEGHGHAKGPRTPRGPSVGSLGSRFGQPCRMETSVLRSSPPRTVCSSTVPIPRT